MRKCAICAKGSRMGGKRRLLRAHYNLTKTERKYPNLQLVRLSADRPKAGLRAGERVKVCTACLKTLAKTRR